MSGQVKREFPSSEIPQQRHFIQVTLQTVCREYQSRVSMVLKKYHLCMPPTWVLVDLARSLVEPSINIHKNITTRDSFAGVSVVRHNSAHHTSV